MALITGTNVNLQVAMTGLIAAAGPIGNVEEILNTSLGEAFTAGTGTGQVDTAYAQSFSLAASASETLGLNGGGLTDPFGEAVNFLHVKALILKVNAGGGGVIFGNPASAGAPLFFGAVTQTVEVDPGEVFAITKGSGAGWPITASTAMNVKLLNTSASLAASGTLILLGTSV